METEIFLGGGGEGHDFLSPVWGGPLIFKIHFVEGRELLSLIFTENL